MNIHDFIKNLRINKTFSSKQSIVIDNILVYFEDLVVYKVIIQVNPSMMKKAKKLNLPNEYLTIFFDGPSKTKLKFDEDKNYDLDKGKFIAIYDIHRIICNVYPGEESEEEQLKKRNPFFNGLIFTKQLTIYNLR